MPGDREPLRALWDAVEAPPAHRELDGEDDATRAAVAWLRDAYSRVEAAPVAVLPQRRARRTPLWLAIAAAAALLLLARIALRDAQPDALPEQARAEPPTPPAAPQKVQVLASDEQRLELRAGTVRLILLHPQTRTNS
jgi:hypothetical protein